MPDVHIDALCPVATVTMTGPRYTAAEIEVALPKGKPKLHEPVVPLALAPLGPANLPFVDDVAEHLGQARPQLWEGQWEEIHRIGTDEPIYPSQSEADMALANHIARELVARSAPLEHLHQLTESVFDRSALAQREKWCCRSDYRAATIGKACASAIRWSLTRVGALVDWTLHGDVRNAAFFADMWHGRLVYVPERKQWMQWDKDRWHWCEQGEEIERAKETCVALLAAAGAELVKDPDRGKRFVREAAQAHAAPRIKAMLELAQSDPKLVVSFSHLDANPHLLGVGNGVVNLQTGFISPNAPGLYITRHCAADYDPNAACPRWMKFLGEVFKRDKATIEAVQRLLGYTLIGMTSEEIIIFCVGFGANGKSIFGNVVATIMGAYAKTAPSTLLAARRTDDHSARNDIAMLDGARLVSINELPGGMQLDEQVVKQLAGREPISARYLYGEFFTFRPRFTPWVRTNHKPIIKGDDHAIWRRIVILPFRRTFSPSEQDPHLEPKLLAERDGILSWMVEGARMYLQDGLKPSRAMTRELNQYRKESDLLGEFLDECTTAKTGTKVLQSALYDSWKSWCEASGAQPGSKKTFTQRLAERGFSAAKSNGNRFYSGLSGRSDPPPSAEHTMINFRHIGVPNATSNGSGVAEKSDRSPDTGRGGRDCRLFA
jgi:putative DNA primase/helicase